MTTPAGSKFFRQLWGLNIMPKWKIFLWELWYNCLATASNLHARDIPIINHCLTCLHDDEDDHHIFRSCPLALEAWARSPITINPLLFPSLTLASWLDHWIGKFLREDGYRGCRLSQFINTLFAIWNTRNDQIFRHSRATLQKLQLHVDNGFRQHTIFSTATNYDARPPPAPNYDLPPGFHIVQLGRL